MENLRTGFVDVAAAADVQRGELLPVEAAGKRLVLANSNGRICALQRVCPHHGADLAEGHIEDGTLVCPRHKAAFDLTTGRAVELAHLMFLKFKTKDAETFPVQVENRRVLVAIPLRSA